MYNGISSFTDLLPNGDAILNKYFNTSTVGDTKYLIDPLKDESGNLTSFFIYENNSDKDEAIRRGTGTTVTVEQAKAGNWNPASNTVDVNQSFSLNDNGQVTGSPVSGSTDTNSGSSSSGSASSWSGSKANGIVHVDSQNIGTYQEKIKKDFEKINSSLNEIQTQLKTLNSSGLKNDQINSQVNGLIKSINKRINWNSNKHKMINNNIDKDIEFAAVVQAAIEGMAEQLGVDLEKLQAKAEQQ